MAHDKWEDKPISDPWGKVAGLAWFILNHTGDGGVNYYKGAGRLRAGKAQDDEDFWADMVRGNAHPELWYHGPDSTTDKLDIIRSARIPYIVSNAAGNTAKHYLDHLLVGYADSTETGAGSTWDVSDGSGHAYQNLAKLGGFLIDDLWPSNVFVAPARLPNWQDLKSGGNPAGWDAHTPTTYAGSLPWSFRELRIKVDKSVRIRIGRADRKVAYLMVGYEGGGGW
jgi:hypothetical protein